MTETQQPPTDGNPQEMWEDYWSVPDVTRHYLPDGKQYVDIKPMNEGARKQHEAATSSDMIVNRDQSARVSMDQAKERHSIIKNSLVGWDVRKGGEVVLFTKQNLDKFLQDANPKIIDEIAHACRLANPWLQDEMEVDAIDQEIERLQELRKQTVDRKAGEASSANS